MNPLLPLVLIPGLLNTSRLWAAQSQALGPRRSIQVADSAGADSLRGLADAILGQAPERFALAGLSMGGYVAFEILRRAPLRIDRLCLIDTTARPDTADASSRRRMLMEVAARDGIGAVLPLLVPGFLAPRHATDTRLVGIIGEMAAAVGVDGFVRQQLAILARPDSRPDLPSIGIPTTVIVGADDQLTPRDRAEEMVEAIPGARLAVIPDAGHLSPLENPAAVTAAMQEWLA
ncbi:MAG: alpha/beta fold hydrolase [Alphaproteobacteria bacterium]|nr:alpha/beta fold hydrolase [Alphaproteobacteria bacterium]